MDVDKRKEKSVNPEEAKERTVKPQFIQSPQEKVGDDDIPPMPQTKPQPIFVQNASARKLNRHRSGKSRRTVNFDSLRELFAVSRRSMLLAALSLLLILALFLGLGLSALKIHRLPPPPTDLAWHALDIPNLQDELFVRAGGARSRYQDLLSLYLRKDELGEYVLPALISEHEQVGKLSTPFVLRPLENVAISPEDQLLLGQLFLARRDFFRFRDWQKAFLRRFPEADFSEGGKAENWPLCLAYLRQLLLSAQIYDDKQIKETIKQQAFGLLPLFENKLPASQRINLHPLRYPEVDAAEPENMLDGGESETPVLRLADVDLWVLKTLASLFQEWQDCADSWTQILAEAAVENDFLAYGLTADEKTLIPSAGSTFRVDTLQNLCLLQILRDAGLPFDKGASRFALLLARDSQLYADYHMVSLTPLSMSPSLEAELRLLDLLGHSGDVSVREGLEQALAQFRLDQERSLGEHSLYYVKVSLEIRLPFRENALAVLYAAP